MNQNKIVFLRDKKLLSTMEENFSLASVEKWDYFEVFEWKRGFWEEFENLVCCYYENFSKAYEYVSENYDIYKIIIIDQANILSSIDLKPGDIVIPNTFLNAINNDAVFIEYAIGENYDLNKFGLSLNGICVSGYNEEEIDVCADVRNNDIFQVVKDVSLDENIDKTVVILSIEWNEGSNNILNVMELVL